MEFKPLKHLVYLLDNHLFEVALLLDFVSL